MTKKVAPVKPELTPAQEEFYKHISAHFAFGERIDAGSVPIDLGGHFENLKLADFTIRYDCEHIKSKIKSAFGFYGRRDEYETTTRVFKLLDEANKNGTAFEPVSTGRTLLQCNHCGQDVEFLTDGLKIWAANPCPHPNGHPAYEFELNVPSGLFVIGNDFRSGFQVIGDYNINSIVGCAETSWKYASVGLAHAFVGNTCPGFYKVDKQTFVIGTASPRRNPIKGAKHVGGICTDLWWYSVADYDEWVRRYGEEPSRDDTVACRPGVYKFKHQYHLIDRNSLKAQVYTYIDWVREPDPLVDYKGQFDKLNLTAGQVLADVIKSWPSLYGGPDGIYVAVDSLLCHGRDVHPNGFCCSNPDLSSDAPEMEIPVLEKEHSWYPFSDYSFLAAGSGIGKDFSGNSVNVDFNESFTALAFNALRCMIVYGIRPMSGADHSKSTLANAKKAFRAMCKKYPDRIPENCKGLL